MVAVPVQTRYNGSNKHRGKMVVVPLQTNGSSPTLQRPGTLAVPQQQNNLNHPNNQGGMLAVPQQPDSINPAYPQGGAVNPHTNTSSSVPGDGGGVGVVVGGGGAGGALVGGPVSDGRLHMYSRVDPRQRTTRGLMVIVYAWILTIFIGIGGLVMTILAFVYDPNPEPYSISETQRRRGYYKEEEPEPIGIPALQIAGPIVLVVGIISTVVACLVGYKKLRGPGALGGNRVTAQPRLFAANQLPPGAYAGQKSSNHRVLDG